MPATERNGSHVLQDSVEFFLKNYCFPKKTSIRSLKFEHIDFNFP